MTQAKISWLHFLKITKQFESDILRVIWDSSKIIHFNIFGIAAACSWYCYLAFMTFADCTKLVSSPYVLPCVVVHICYCNSRVICIMRLHLWYQVDINQIMISGSGIGRETIVRLFLKTNLSRIRASLNNKDFSVKNILCENLLQSISNQPTYYCKQQKNQNEIGFSFQTYPEPEGYCALEKRLPMTKD